MKFRERLRDLVSVYFAPRIRKIHQLRPRCPEALVFCLVPRGLQTRLCNERISVKIFQKYFLKFNGLKNVILVYLTLRSVQIGEVRKCCTASDSLISSPSLSVTTALKYK